MSDEVVLRTVERQVDYGKSMYESGREVGAREERVAITGWLNSWASHLAAHPHRNDTDLLWWIAKQIEAGEHRKEADRVE